LAALITRETVATFDSNRPKRSGNDWFDIRFPKSAHQISTVCTIKPSLESRSWYPVHFRVLMP
jgi:hypothetical protein